MTGNLSPSEQVRVLWMLALPDDRPLTIRELRIAGQLAPLTRLVVDVQEHLIVLLQESGPPVTAEISCIFYEDRVQ